MQVIAIVSELFDTQQLLLEVITKSTSTGESWVHHRDQCNYRTYLPVHKLLLEFEMLF